MNQTLLAKFTDLVNTYGADSYEAQAFLKRHSGNSELIKLCNTVLDLKLKFANGSIRLE
jgi:hypothetical protein